jgi:hypothetical protein
MLTRERRDGDSKPMMHATLPFCDPCTLRISAAMLTRIQTLMPLN